jgi:hypothetical protein
VGVFESGDVIQVSVIQLFPHRFKGLGNIRVIDEPAEAWIALSGDNDLGLEAVSVQPAAFVRLREVRQPVGGLELEGLAEFDFHRREAVQRFSGWLGNGHVQGCRWRGLESSSSGGQMFIVPSRSR